MTPLIDTTPTTNPVTAPYRWVYEAIRFLSARDPDHALDENGLGFNGRDTEFGNSIAQKPFEFWTPKMLLAAHRLLRTYKNSQLPAGGFDYDALPAPTEALLNAPRTSSGTDFRPRTIGLTDKGDFLIAWDVRDSRFDALKDEVKTLPARQWNATLKGWVIPAKWEALTPLTAFAERWAIPLDEEINARMAEVFASGKAVQAARATDIAASKALDADITVEGLGGTLRPFQRAGVAYAARKRRTFIADEMGLGKTIQSLATAVALNAFPLIIVTTASVKLQFAREARKWVPSKRTHVINGKTVSDDPSADIFVLNRDILTKHVDALVALKPKGVVFDESHSYKNPKAARSIAAATLAECVPTDGMVLNLTGTPILSRPSELPHQLRLLGMLDTEFGGYWKFINRYCAPVDNGFGIDMSGSSNTVELNERLRSTCYIRRVKADVMPELPAVQRSTIPVALTNRARYEFAEAELIRFLKEEAQKDRAFLASLVGLDDDERAQALAQRAADVGRKAERAEHLVRIEALKRLSVEGKMKAISDWVGDFLETGKKLVLFTWHVDVTQRISEQFNAPAILGGVSAAKRQAIVDSFQNDPSVPLLVCNIEAAKEGLTLTAASDVAFVELGWTPAAHDQAEARCYGRLNDAHGVNAHYIVGERTIDEDIAELIDSKRAVVDAVTDGTATARSASIMSDLTDRLMRRSA